MSEIREETQAKIDNVLSLLRHNITTADEDFHYDYAIEARNQILSIESLAIVDRDAKLPENPHKPRHFEYQSQHWFRAEEARQIYHQAQKDMAGYVLEVKE